MGYREDMMRNIDLAINDEWLAHYQYWAGSILLPEIYEDVIFQFVEHSSDEYDHATELGAFVLDSAGEMLLPDPRDGFVRRACGYLPPKTRDVHRLVQDALDSERCAVGMYMAMIEEIRGDDSVFGDDLLFLLDEIRAKEEEHVRDLLEIQQFFLR